MRQRGTEGENAKEKEAVRGLVMAMVMVSRRRDDGGVG